MSCDPGRHVSSSALARSGSTTRSDHDVMTRRRWPQFTLRTLVWITFVMAVFAWATRGGPLFLPIPKPPGPSASDPPVVTLNLRYVAFVFVLMAPWIWRFVMLRRRSPQLMLRTWAWITIVLAVLAWATRRGPLFLLIPNPPDNFGSPPRVVTLNPRFLAFFFVLMAPWLWGFIWFRRQGDPIWQRMMRHLRGESSPTHET